MSCPQIQGNTPNDSALYVNGKGICTGNASHRQPTRSNMSGASSKSSCPFSCVTRDLDDLICDIPLENPIHLHSQQLIREVAAILDNRISISFSFTGGSCSAKIRFGSNTPQKYVKVIGKLVKGFQHTPPASSSCDQESDLETTISELPDHVMRAYSNPCTEPNPPLQLDVMETIEEMNENMNEDRLSVDPCQQNSTKTDSELPYERPLSLRGQRHVFLYQCRKNEVKQLLTQNNCTNLRLASLDETWPSLLVYTAPNKGAWMRVSRALQKMDRVGFCRMRVADSFQKIDLSKIENITNQYGNGNACVALCVQQPSSPSNPSVSVCGIEYYVNLVFSMFKQYDALPSSLASTPFLDAGSSDASDVVNSSNITTVHEHRPSSDVHNAMITDDAHGSSIVQYPTHSANFQPFSHSSIFSHVSNEKSRDSDSSWNAVSMNNSSNNHSMDAGSGVGSNNNNNSNMAASSAYRIEAHLNSSTNSNVHRDNYDSSSNSSSNSSNNFNMVRDSKEEGTTRHVTNVDTQSLSMESNALYYPQNSNQDIVYDTNNSSSLNHSHITHHTNHNHHHSILDSFNPSTQSTQYHLRMTEPTNTSSAIPSYPNGMSSHPSLADQVQTHLIQSPARRLGNQAGESELQSHFSLSDLSSNPVNSEVNFSSNDPFLSPAVSSFQHSPSVSMPPGAFLYPAPPIPEDRERDSKLSVTHVPMANFSRVPSTQQHTLMKQQQQNELTSMHSSSGDQPSHSTLENGYNMMSNFILGGTMFDSFDSEEKADGGTLSQSLFDNNTSSSTSNSNSTNNNSTLNQNLLHKQITRHGSLQRSAVTSSMMDTDDDLTFPSHIYDGNSLLGRKDMLRHERVSNIEHIPLNEQSIHHLNPNEPTAIMNAVANAVANDDGDVSLNGPNQRVTGSHFNEPNDALLVSSLSGMNHGPVHDQVNPWSSNSNSTNNNNGPREYYHTISHSSSLYIDQPLSDYNTYSEKSSGMNSNDLLTRYSQGVNLEPSDAYMRTFHHSTNPSNDFGSINSSHMFLNSEPRPRNSSYPSISSIFGTSMLSSTAESVYGTTSSNDLYNPTYHPADSSNSSSNYGKGKSVLTSELSGNGCTNSISMNTSGNSSITAGNTQKQVELSSASMQNEENPSSMKQSRLRGIKSLFSKLKNKDSTVSGSRRPNPHYVLSSSVQPHAVRDKLQVNERNYFHREGDLDVASAGYNGYGSSSSRRSYLDEVPSNEW